MIKRRIAVRGIIYKDNKLMCVLHNDSSGYLATPGGGLNTNEALLDGLHREMIEETGVAPDIGRLLFVQQFSPNTIDEHLEFFFHIKNAEDYTKIDLSKTTHGMQEIKVIDFFDPQEHHILPLFLTQIDLEKHINSDHPVAIYSYN